MLKRKMEDVGQSGFYSERSFEHDLGYRGYNIIVCTDTCGGIGLKGTLPWRNIEELQLFRKLTKGSTLIMGRKTVENLPFLKDRTIFCVTRSKSYKPKFDNIIVVSCLNTAFSRACTLNENEIFVAGGGSLYDLVLLHPFPPPKNVFKSTVPGDYKCDTFFKHIFLVGEWDLVQTIDYDTFIWQSYQICTSSAEQDYMDLLCKVYNKPSPVEGRNGLTRRHFCAHLTINLRFGFPLLTTKRLPFKMIVRELMFFIRGDTDTKKLEQMNINIWKFNTDRKFLDENGFPDRKEGQMGPMYGWQWRRFGAEFDEKTGSPLTKGLDQLSQVINLIRTDPTSRRILMTDYNPSQAAQGVLYPCHSLILQFFVDGPFLDMTCYNRSSDLFLGLPFNIASSSLLQILIAEVTGLVPRMFHLTLGDAHIYEEHLSAVKTQLNRYPYKLPTVRLKKKIETLQEMEVLGPEDFELCNYTCHPKIKARMVA
jgi:thymidylate synthase